MLFYETAHIFLTIYSMKVKVRNATKILGEEGETYKMTSKPRGMALIISNTKFSEDRYEER